MTDLSDKQYCPICGAQVKLYLQGSRDSVTGDEFEVRRCTNCSLGITWPRPVDLFPYYTDYHGGRHGKTASHCVKRRMSLVTGMCGPGNHRVMLDIGCGDGAFLLKASGQGWQVFGTEINPEPARQAGVRVFENLQDCVSVGPFDCVTLWHSLEHLEDPVQTLLDAHRLLRSGGVLIVAVPNAAGLQADIFGRHWFHLDTPRHLYHFATKSLGCLMHSTGFVPIAWRHQEFEYDLMGWSQSALNALSLPHNLFFNMLLKRPTTASRPVKGLTYVLGALFCGLALPFVPVGTMLSRGGTLIVGSRAQ